MKFSCACLFLFFLGRQEQPSPDLQYVDDLSIPLRGAADIQYNTVEYFQSEKSQNLLGSYCRLHGDAISPWNSAASLDGFDLDDVQPMDDVELCSSVKTQHVQELHAIFLGGLQADLDILKKSNASKYDQLTLDAYVVHLRKINNDTIPLPKSVQPAMLDFLTTICMSQHEKQVLWSDFTKQYGISGGQVNVIETSLR